MGPPCRHHCLARKQKPASKSIDDVGLGKFLVKPDQCNPPSSPFNWDALFIFLYKPKTLLKMIEVTVNCGLSTRDLNKAHLCKPRTRDSLSLPSPSLLFPRSSSLWQLHYSFLRLLLRDTAPAYGSLQKYLRSREAVLTTQPCESFLLLSKPFTTVPHAHPRSARCFPQAC